jgi:hypothetical protein
MATTIVADSSAPTTRKTKTSKPRSRPCLPENVRELASAALMEAHGLARAALIVHETPGDNLSLELAAAVRHMLRRIAVLADSVLFPLIDTAVEHSYTADDFESMKELMGLEEPNHG